MAKNITLRNSTSTNSGKEAKMSHAEMDANLETFFMSSSLDGTTLYLHSTGSTNVDSIDLSGLGGSGVQGIQGVQGTTGTGIQGIQGLSGTGIQGTDGAQGTQGIAGGASAQGTQGIQGLEGTGTQGTQGIAGGASAQGIQGPQGAQGLEGTGTQGTQGIAGGASAQGIQGLQGTDGNQGIQGLSGGASAQGTQGIQGIQGTAGTVGADGISSGRTYYFNRSVTEPNTGKSTLGTSPTGLPETSISILSLQNTDTKLTDFISEPFDFTIIPGGVQRFQLWMTKANQTDDIETFTVLKLTDNSGNVLATVGTSQATDIGWNNNNTTPVQVTVDITLPTAAVSLGQRMLVEVWTRNNENQDYTTTLYTEGASHYSYVVTTVEAQPGVQGIQGTQGIQGIQGESIQGVQGIQGIQSTQGVQGVKGLQGTQGIQGQGITANSLTLASSSETLGSHNDATKHTVQPNWTRLALSGASFINGSGKTKSYLVVFGLETSSTYSNNSPGPFNIDVRIADASTGAVIYTEWRDTVMLYRNTSEVSARVTKTYVSHVYNLGDGDDFAIWVRGDSSLLGTLYVEYSLLTVTELTGLPAGTLN